MLVERAIEMDSEPRRELYMGGAGDVGGERRVGGGGVELDRSRAWELR